MKLIICGYEIESHRKTISTPAHVTLHRLGVAGSQSWLTPAEARALASAIDHAAKTTEGEN